MKKRLISLLLTVVMLVSLFSGLAVSASADANVATVTLNSGDTVLGLCQKYGIDYYTYRNLIMTLNGITDESQFSKLAVGTNIVLPVSNAAAAALSGGSSSAVGGGTVGGSNGSGLTNGSVVQLPTGDHPAYYLVTYTVQKGDTIGGIYASMGLSYKTYQNQIVKLNNLRNINSVQVGQTLVLPTTSPGLANTTYTTIMAHTMRSGESAYNIICGSYGLDYNSNLQKLRALNNRDDLGKFRIGEILYIPVAGVVDTNTNVGGGNSGSNTSGSVNNSGYFNLVSQNAENGTFDLQVSGKTVKTASAGQLVNVVATPETGYAVDTIKVVKVGDAATAVTVSNSSFVMPSYSVTISVTFKKAVQSEIKVDSSVNGGIAVMVNSERVDKAYAGAQVEVKTAPATGFILDKIRVTYNDYRDTIAVENGKFTMPNFPVTVSATFKVDPDYKPSMGNNIYTDISNGKLIAKVGTTEVTRAKAGDTVTLEVKPDENYTLESIRVYYDGYNKTVELDKMSFIMPDEPVNVVAVVKPTEKATFAIKKAATSEGSFKTLVDGKEVDAAKVGQTVTVEGTSSKAFYYYITTVTKTDDSSVLVFHGEEGQFTMPDFPVTVSVKFYIYHNVTLTSNTNGSFNVTSDVTGGVVTRCAPGPKLNINVWGITPGMSLGKITVTYADGSTHVLVGENSFIMPDCDVRVSVEFNQNGKIKANAPTVDGVQAANLGNGYDILGKKLSDKNKDSVSVDAGKGNIVVVSPYYAVGYELDKITYTYKDATKAEITKDVEFNKLMNRYQFEMPDVKGDVTVNVSFKKIPSYKIVVNYGANEDHKMGSVDVMTKMGIINTAAANADVIVRFYPADGYGVKLSAVKVMHKLADGTLVSSLPCEMQNDSILGFKMPGALADGSYIEIDIANAFVDMQHKITLLPVDLPSDPAAEDQFPMGTLKVSDDGGSTVYTVSDLENKKFPMGTKITIISESREGYSLNTDEPITVVRTDGSTVPVYKVIDNKFSFTMPLDNVTVSANYGESTYGITKVEPEHGSFTVPLQGKWRANVPITEIVPEEGYQLEGFYITYTSVAGEYREEKLVANELGAYEIKAFDGLPKSAVTIKAVFEAVKNDMTIFYTFSSTDHKDTSSYKVNLIYDDTTVNIDRDITSSDIADYVRPENGIPTGKTVRVVRNETNMDTNYKIGKVWAIAVDSETYVPTPVDVTTADGQISFVMPALEGKSLCLNVLFERVDGDNSYLVSKNVANGTVNAPERVPLGNTPSIVITANDGYNVPASVTVKYTDIDGKEQSITPVLTDNLDGTASFTLPEKYSPGIDITKPVVVEGVCEAKPVTITATADTGAEAWEVKTDAKPGEEVVAKLNVKPGFAVVEVTLDGVVLAPEADGSYKFTMPSTACTLNAACTDLRNTIVYKQDDSAKEATFKLTYEDGSAMVDNKVVKGSWLEVKATKLPEDKKVAEVIWTLDGVEYPLAPNADGRYIARFDEEGKTYTYTVILKDAAASASFLSEEDVRSQFKLSSTAAFSLNDLEISKADGKYIIKTTVTITSAYYETEGGENVEIELTKEADGYSFSLGTEKPLSAGGKIVLS